MDMERFAPAVNKPRRSRGNIRTRVTRELKRLAVLRQKQEAKDARTTAGRSFAEFWERTRG